MCSANQRSNPCVYDSNTLMPTQLATPAARANRCTCSNAQRTCILLRSLGFKALVIHGQMSQSKRQAALNNFKVCMLPLLLDLVACKLSRQQPSCYSHHVPRLHSPRCC